MIELLLPSKGPYGDNVRHTRVEFTENELNHELNNMQMGIVPLGKSHWYKKDLNFFSNVLNKDRSSTGYCIMKGSRHYRSLSSNHVYADLYIFAEWLGARFAKYVSRTGNKYISIRTNRFLAWVNHHSINNCFMSYFGHGFRKHIKTSEIDFFATTNNKHMISSSIYFCTNHGMTRDQYNQMRKLLINLTENDLLEKITKGE